MQAAAGDFAPREALARALLLVPCGSAPEGGITAFADGIDIEGMCAMCEGEMNDPWATLLRRMPRDVYERIKEVEDRGGRALGFDASEERERKASGALVNFWSRWAQIALDAPEEEFAALLKGE